MVGDDACPPSATATGKTLPVPPGPPPAPELTGKTKTALTIKWAPPPVTGGAPVMLYQVHTDHGDASLDADAFELVSTDRERRYKVRRPAAKQNQPTQKTTTHTHVNRKTHRA